MRVFTTEELAKYDGSGENPSYVGYNGKVYDVTGAPNWEEGGHFQHLAGEDLTEEMEDAPHGDYVMDDFPVVGELAP